MTISEKFPSSSLATRDLSCERGGRHIVASLDLTLNSGIFLKITGINGAGKSTFLMCLAQHLPFSGEVEFDIEGHDSSEIPVTECMAFIAHQNALKPEMSTAENLTFWADVTNGDRNLIEPAIEQATLSELGHIPIGKLSKGQQRRASLARLLVTEKPIWLLDEPTSALDTDGDAWVAKLISNHLRKGGMVIAATHRPIILDDDIKVQTLELEPI